MPPGYWRFERLGDSSYLPGWDHSVIKQAEGRASAHPLAPYRMRLGARPYKVGSRTPQFMNIFKTTAVLSDAHISCRRVSPCHTLVPSSAEHLTTSRLVRFTDPLVRRLLQVPHDHTRTGSFL